MPTSILWLSEGASSLGAPVDAMADQIARAIRVAPRQTLDLGAWLPLPSADTPAAGLRLAYGRCARPQRSAVIVAATLAACGDPHAGVPRGSVIAQG
jgi:hypothetical protein